MSSAGGHYVERSKSGWTSVAPRTARRTDSIHALRECVVKGRRAADGPRERRHDPEGVHAGARRLSPRRGGDGRKRIVHDCSQNRSRRALTVREAVEIVGGPAGLEPATSWFVG